MRRPARRCRCWGSCTRPRTWLKMEARAGETAANIKNNRQSTGLRMKHPLRHESDSGNVGTRTNLSVAASDAASGKIVGNVGRLGEEGWGAAFLAGAETGDARACFSLQVKRGVRDGFCKEQCSGV